jgi:myosin heavy subunit
LFKIISAILHLGNINFGKDQSDNASLTKFCQLLDLKEETVTKAFISRTYQFLSTEDLVESPLNNEEAHFARDALTKDLYERVFNWILEMINTSIAVNIFY